MQNDIHLVDFAFGLWSSISINYCKNNNNNNNNKNKAILTNQKANFFFLF